MRIYSYASRKPITIEKLVKFCKSIEGRNRQESIRLGNKIGLSVSNVDNLRKILGYSSTITSHKFTAAKREEIAREYCDSECSLNGLARKYGVRQNAIRCLLRCRGIAIRNPNAWSRKQEMFILNEKKRGTPLKDIAGMIGKSQKAVKAKLARLRLPKT